MQKTKDKLGMKKILIREMGERDIESVVRIERISFSCPWSEVSFSNEIHKPRSIPKVAVLDDAVVGYLCAEYVADEGHILNLAIHPDFRSMDIATSLVGDIIDELKLRACRFIYLEVRTSNEIAKRLYKDFGFRLIGVRKNYYVGPIEDGVIMMLEI